MTTFLISALLLAGCLSKASDGGKVIARFDGTTITDKQFTRKVASLPKDVKAYALGHKRDFLEDMISEHYLLKEAQRRGIEKNPEVRELIESAQKKIITAKLIEIEVDKKITLDSAEAQTYYDEHKEEFMTPLTLRASHILVKTEVEAGALKAELQAGGDFENIARKNSLDATAIRGGDLGFFQKGQFLPEFEQVVFAMNKGELKGPVHTQFGYHLIKLTDRLEPALRSFDSVKPLIGQRLANLKRSRLFKTFISGLKKDLKPNIDEQALESTGD